jgi:hypothetical protein
MVLKQYSNTPLLHYSRPKPKIAELMNDIKTINLVDSTRAAG